MAGKRDLEARQILLDDLRSLGSGRRNVHRKFAGLRGKHDLGAVQHRRLQRYAYLALALGKRRSDGDLVDYRLDNLVDDFNNLAHSFSNGLGARRLRGGDLRRRVNRHAGNRRGNSRSLYDGWDVVRLFTGFNSRLFNYRRRWFLNYRRCRLFNYRRSRPFSDRRSWLLNYRRSWLLNDRRSCDRSVYCRRDY